MLLMIFCLCQCMWAQMWMTLTCEHATFWVFTSVIVVLFLTSLSSIAWLIVGSAVTWRRISASLKIVSANSTLWHNVMHQQTHFFLHFSQIDHAFNPSHHWKKCLLWLFCCLFLHLNLFFHFVIIVINHVVVEGPLHLKKKLCGVSVLPQKKCLCSWKHGCSGHQFKIESVQI